MQSLPADVRAAIVSVDYETKLQEITRRQKLLIDQAGKLEMETTLVMIGLEPLSDYIANLERELGLSEERAREVAVDVSDNIFKPIRASLQTLDYASAAETVGNGTETTGTEEKNTKFTNSNEISLNRDQILSEIENPIPNRQTSAPVAAAAENVPTPQSTALEIRPEQELETVPGETVKDVESTPVKINTNIFEAKMGGPTITTKQVVDLPPTTKLLEGEKKRPSSGVDPYREPVN